MLPLFEKKNFSAENLHTSCSSIRLDEAQGNVALYDLTLAGNVFFKENN